MKKILKIFFVVILLFFFSLIAILFLSNPIAFFEQPTERDGEYSYTIKDAERWERDGEYYRFRDPELGERVVDVKE